MDVFLSKVTQQAMNYAIRSGITITATYAIRQSSRLLKNVDGSERDELQSLQDRLRSKIHIISPAIDMIELIAARGNTSLESAVSLTKGLRWDIQALGQRLAKAAASEEHSRRGGKSSSQTRAQNDLELKLIIQDIKKLLNRIEDAVPLINLAITTSGASLSTNLPSTVSPSRLLQASTFLTAGDTQYFISPGQATQVGPTFTLSMYMLFAGHVRPQDEEGIRETTWKEVIHKARVKLRRVPMSSMFPSSTDPEGRPRLSHMPAEARGDEYAYQILIIEDLDDDRVHTLDENEPQPESFEGVPTAGMREIIPIHQISKIFYADTGKILNIGTEGETNNPVLLLKRDVNAFPPRRMLDRQEAEYDDYGDDEFEKDHEEGNGADHPDDGLQSQIDAQLSGDHQQESPLDDIPDVWRLPPGLDPEWVAFEVYTEIEDSESESETEPASSPGPTSRSRSVDPQITDQLSSLNLNTPSKSPSQSPNPQHQISLPPRPSNSATASNPLFNNIRTSLSLLETLLRLTSLQQFQQQSHLSITDELLNFFLEESSTTGAGGDEQHRQRLRAEARRKVGWDPYDESPLKRRGEDYQTQGGYSAEEGGWEGSPGRWDSVRDEDYPPSPSDKRQSGFQIRSRQNTPEASSNNGYRASASPSPSSRAKGADNRRTSGVGAGAGVPAALRRQFPTDSSLRKGSPLSRPMTAQTDEGIGTSPSSLYASNNGKNGTSSDGQAQQGGK
ncbi:hypothetical protein FQN54_007154 [Arachnomyces sp. PD_36]|nr:hypothetical protein FQN54_007154 [Arachnomyces sp. PD_36]